MSARKKVKGLVDLAIDERTPSKERRAAAMKAVKLIAKYKLLDSPLDVFAEGAGGETVAVATEVFKQVADPRFLGNLKKLGGALGRAARRG